MKWSMEQETAIDLAVDVTNRIVCVTGGAGVGKTSIIAEVCKKLQAQFDTFVNNAGETISEVVLCAPTGRAAKRIEEATGIPAMTIHRMLRYTMPEDDAEFGLPMYSKTNPMPYKVVLIDEASMLTKELRRAIIDALPAGGIIRFFGDVNQLPPIDPNQKPGELLHSPFAADLKKFPSMTLTKNFRSEDGIIKVAQNVIDNRIPLPNSQVELFRVGYDVAMSKIAELATRVDFTKDENQIICPTKVNKTGCEALNRMFQLKFNPEKEKINIYMHDKVSHSIVTRAFKRGDKMLWIKNDYELDIMNGTLGRVIDFDEETGNILINIDGKDKEIPSVAYGRNTKTGEVFEYDPRQRMILGYAISTHAAQGSQFDYVCYIISRSRVATRQNVYTAFTRAKSRLTVVNIGGALNHAIANITKLQ